ncbi:MAG TPA: tyrosine-type recombinase/integrase, partial [Acetobacteraceae bacterium]|nr:tyrosine-type recombinase/integrase [Acetobacteraceae bacterium]
PELLGPTEIRAFQLYLARDKKLAASSIGVAVAAIRFLYNVTLRRGWNVDDVVPTCRRPQTLPVVMSPEEVVRFLDAVEDLKHRAILTVCYAAGLRIAEAFRLTPAAIDRQRMTIRVEQGKGRKDRYVMLSPRLLNILRDYYRTVRPRDWLFPGDLPGQPITASAVQDVCRTVFLCARPGGQCVQSVPRRADAFRSALCDDASRPDLCPDALCRRDV